MVVVVTFGFEAQLLIKNSQASSLVLSTRHMLHWVQSSVSRELVSSLGGGVNNIWYALCTSEVLAMAICNIA